MAARRPASWAACVLLLALPVLPAICWAGNGTAADQDAATAANATILEDLVNQFLEKSAQAAGPSDQEPAAAPEVAPGAATARQARPDFMQHTKRQALPPDPVGASPHRGHIQDEHQQPASMQLIAAPPGSSFALPAGDEEELANEKLELTDDRYIPYDVPAATNATSPTNGRTEPDSDEPQATGGRGQARSMGAGSRPPYATQDHFRPDSSTPPLEDSSVEALSSATVAGAGESLVNSIRRISTHLSAEAGSTSTRASPVSASDKQLERLASPGQLVYLSPTPAAELSAYDNRLGETQHEQAQLGPFGQQLPVLSTQMAHTEHNSSPGTLFELSPVNSSASNNTSRTHNNDRYTGEAGAQSGSTQATAQPSDELGARRAHLNRKTLEQQSQPYHQQQQQQPQQFPDGVNRLQHRLAAHSGSHAAALVNITAPLTLPHSASEAMLETMMAAGDHHHQAKASSRLPVADPSQAIELTTTRPQASRQRPQSSSDSIYLPPANSLPVASGAASETERTRLDSNGLPVLTERRGTAFNATPTHQASGFRAPTQMGWPGAAAIAGTGAMVARPLSYLAGLSAAGAPSSVPPLASTGPSQQVYTGSSTTSMPSSAAVVMTRAPALITTTTQLGAVASSAPPSSSSGVTTNGFITSGVVSTVSQGSVNLEGAQGDNQGTVVGVPSSSGGSGGAKRALNLTRVEHISAECSNDLIKTVIVFNGTFKGIIYSSGYVRDPSCLYINGSGTSSYEFSIRLNQCGTLGRQEVHAPDKNSELRRRDQVMWNTLTIQYNPIIEQEWDEHFRVSCEYGSDFWKTISFSPFNVETNTGAPVVFTVDPPQCQMEILRGHGMVGPRQEAVSGPVTVGDPLTLLIHMKSEKAGYDILVKNCFAHNGGHQRMQLIDPNGCVVNERFISPFRGTYNDMDRKHVTLFSYLKAFRFTGSPVLYIECEIHMCQSSCPPQMCYWRRLSKRSASHNHTLGLTGPHEDIDDDDHHHQGHEDHNTPNGTLEPSTAQASDLPGHRRQARRLSSPKPAANQDVSDKVNLFQALEVRQERDPSAAAYPLSSTSLGDEPSLQGPLAEQRAQTGVCYRRAEMVAYLVTIACALCAAICLALGCCWRVGQLRRRLAKVSAAAASAAGRHEGSECFHPQRSHLGPGQVPFMGPAGLHNGFKRHQQQNPLLSSLQHVSSGPAMA